MEYISITNPSGMKVANISEPVIYDSKFEVLEENEAKINAELVETLRSISEATFKDSGHATRSVHAKSHGLLCAELKVIENLQRG